MRERQDNLAGQVSFAVGFEHKRAVKQNGHVCLVGEAESLFFAFFFFSSLSRDNLEISSLAKRRC